MELHRAVESGGVCVLVQGSSGCGKSTLLREYAGHRGRKEGESLMVVHQGEQIDSKVCILSVQDVYTCICERLGYNYNSNLQGFIWDFLLDGGAKVTQCAEYTTPRTVWGHALLGKF